MTGPRVVVGHVLVAGSPVAQTERPALRPEFTRVGERYVVLAARTSHGLSSFSEDVGPAQAIPELVERVARAAAR